MADNINANVTLHRALTAWLARAETIQDKAMAWTGNEIQLDILTRINAVTPAQAVLHTLGKLSVADTITLFTATCTYLEQELIAAVTQLRAAPAARQ